MLRSFDPASGDLVWEGESAGADAVAAALLRARHAFPAWRALPVETRVAVAGRYRDALEARKDEIARIISRETGKPLWETQSEVA